MKRRDFFSRTCPLTHFLNRLQRWDIDVCRWRCWFSNFFWQSYSLEYLKGKTWISSSIDGQQHCWCFNLFCCCLLVNFTAPLGLTTFWSLVWDWILFHLGSKFSPVYWQVLSSEVLPPSCHITFRHFLGKKLALSSWANSQVVSSQIRILH